MRPRALALALAVALPALSQIRFEELAARSGLSFEVDNGASGRYRQVELMTGGVGALDYDNDGCLDLYFANGAELPSQRKNGEPFFSRLYRGNCDWWFEDVTEDAGIAGEGYSMAVAAADFDNDSDTDIFVAGVNKNTLFRNDGNGRFSDVTRTAGLSGVDDLLGNLWSVSSVWLDYDNDGYLDLYVTNYLFWDPRTEGKCGTPEHPLYCHPDNYRGQPNQLFRNNGDGTFADVSRESGISGHAGKGMGAAFADFNADGFSDIYVANDSVRAFLFENRGDGTFLETGLERGVALREDGAAVAGMGVDFRDFNEDGLPDVLVSGMINDTFLLFRNAGPDLPFDDVTVTSRLALHTRQQTGWGVGIVDLDNDGWKDIFLANSHFPQLGRYLNRPSPQPNAVLRADGTGRYDNVSELADLGPAAYHRGVAFGDFDGDGRMDAAVAALNSPAKLLRNVGGEGNHWLGVRLAGTSSNRDGIGSVVRVIRSDGRILHNEVTTAVGYGSSSEPVARFGLGESNVPVRFQVAGPAKTRSSGRLCRLEAACLVWQRFRRLGRRGHSAAAIEIARPRRPGS